MDAITQPVNDDWRLFRAKGDAAAFGRLVKSLTDLVHSAARRVTQEGSLAEDVTQSVFLLLAKKGRSLPAEVQPGPWCWRQAVRLASNAVRTESRRRNREQLYAVMNEPSQTEDSWRALSPLLDEALASLPAADQAVIVGRYFERQDMSAVGRHLGISAEAAQKRASRALERLRSLLGRRGVGTTAALLSYALKAETVSAAPSSLAIQCVKAASPAIPAGKWPVLLSWISTRTAAAGLAAGLAIAGFCGWQWNEEAREAEQKNARLAASMAAVSSKAAAEEAGTTARAPRLAFAEILRQLAATHWDPDNLATQKRIAWLIAQIDPARLPDAARWMLERRNFYERLHLSNALFLSWLERAPEACADFWADEINGLAGEESRFMRWGKVQNSLYFAVRRDGFDPGRLAAWCQRRITADPALMLSPGWMAMAQEVILRKLQVSPAEAAALVTSLPAGPGRMAFLRESVGTARFAASAQYNKRAALEAFHAIPDETLRQEAVRALLQHGAADDDGPSLDWWRQLPGEDRAVYAQAMLSSPAVRGTDGNADKALREEVLQQMPEEQRTALTLTGTAEYRAVAAEKDFAARLNAAAAITNLQFQARLLRGLYGLWHEQDAAEAEAFLQRSGWPAETQTMLRAAAVPLTP